MVNYRMQFVHLYIYIPDQISGRRNFIPVILNQILLSACAYTLTGEIQERKTSKRLFPFLTRRSWKGSDVRRFSLVTFSSKVQ